MMTFDDLMKELNSLRSRGYLTDDQVEETIKDYQRSAEWYVKDTLERQALERQRMSQKD